MFSAVCGAFLAEDSSILSIRKSFFLLILLVVTSKLPMHRWKASLTEFCLWNAYSTSVWKMEVYGNGVGGVDWFGVTIWRVGAIACGFVAVLFWLYRIRSLCIHLRSLLGRIAQEFTDLLCLGDALLCWGLSKKFSPLCLWTLPNHMPSVLCLNILDFLPAAKICQILDSVMVCRCFINLLSSFW